MARRTFGFFHPLSGKLKCISICDVNSQQKNINRAAKLIVDATIFKINALLMHLVDYGESDTPSIVAGKVRGYANNHPNDPDYDLLIDISQMILDNIVSVNEEYEFVYYQTEVRYKSKPSEFNVYANLLAKKYVSSEKYLLKMAEILKTYHGGNETIGIYRALIWEQLNYTNIFKNLPNERKNAINAILYHIKKSPNFD